MNIRDVLFNDAMDLSKVTKSGLCGATLNPLKKIGDLQNGISIGSASAYLSSDRFKESFPYSISNTSYSELDPYLNPDFGIIILQHLMYEYPETDFTPSEEQFYRDYREYQLGAYKTGDLLTALELLNEWLVTQVLEEPHSEERPTYTTRYADTYINLHFLLELRRQLAGEIEEGTSTFSKAEEQFYIDYQEYTAGVEKIGTTLTAVRELDQWLMKEINGIPHEVLNRDYSTTHKWRKTLTRD